MFLPLEATDDNATVGVQKMHDAHTIAKSIRNEMNVTNIMTTMTTITTTTLRCVHDINIFSIIIYIFIDDVIFCKSQIWKERTRIERKKKKKEQ